MKKINDSIIIKSAETDEELCGRGYVHCTAWKESYRGIVCDRYLDTMTTEDTTARARNFPKNTIVAKDKDKVIGFAVFVWVFEKNERAINFYHKYGFEFDGCKKEWTLGIGYNSQNGNEKSVISLYG